MAAALRKTSSMLARRALISMLRGMGSCWSVG